MIAIVTGEQATWAALVFRVIFDNLSITDRLQDVVQADRLRRHLLLGVLGHSHLLQGGQSADGFYMSLKIAI